MSHKRSNMYRVYKVQRREIPQTHYGSRTTPMNPPTELMEEAGKFAVWLGPKLNINPCPHICITKRRPCCVINEHPDEQPGGLTMHVQAMSIPKNDEWNVYLWQFGDIKQNLAHEFLHIHLQLGELPQNDDELLDKAAKRFVTEYNQLIKQ